MFRTDYAPNRFEACKQAILKLIERRSQFDPSSGFALVTFSDRAWKWIDFQEGAKYDQFSEVLEQLPVGGTSAMGEGLGVAIKMLMEQMRLSGAKVPHILLISDGIFTPGKVAPQ
jgi:Mg-chelatase subunit ChlD